MYCLPSRKGYISAAMAFAAIFGVIFYFCLLMPKASDDFIFRASMGTYTDVFRLAWSKYLNWDGRSIGFLINHTLLYIPHVVASAVIAILFCTLIFVMHVFLHATKWRKRLTATSILSIFCLLWAAMPAFGAVVFWKTGAGYCYYTIFAVLFLLPFRFYFAPGEHTPSQPPASFGKVFSFFIFSVYVGLQDYSLPLLFAIFGFSVYGYRRFFYRDSGKALRLFFAGATGVFLGNMAVFFAPGNAARVGANPDFAVFASLGFFDKAGKFIAKLDYIHSWFLIPYILLAWSLYVLCRTYGLGAWRHFPFWGCVPFVVGQIAIGAFIFSPVSPKRAFTTISVMLLLSAGMFVYAALPHARRGAAGVLTGIKAVLLGYCLLSIPYEMQVFALADTVSHERLNILDHARGAAVCLPAYPIALDRFLPIGDENDIHDVTESPDFWLNKDLATLWKLPAVTRCPRPERFFTAAPGEMAGLKVSLRDGQLTLRKRAGDSGSTEKLEIFYPAKIYDLINPNPLFFFIYDGLGSFVNARELLVPRLYKRAVVALVPDGQGGDVAETRIPREYRVPGRMHFYVRQTGGKSSGLVRFDEMTHKDKATS